MQSLGEQLRARRRELRLTLEQVADRARCAKSYLSMIETGRRRSGPSEAALRRLEGALLLRPGDLVALAQWQATPAPVTLEVQHLQARDRVARELASRLRAADLDSLHTSGELKRLVDRIAPEEAAPRAVATPRGHNGSAGGVATPRGHGGSGAPAGRAAGSPTHALRIALPFQAPVINRVAAGYPREFTDLGYPARIADEHVSVPDVTDPEAFAARVVGDSMAPRYEEGDIVVFSPERDAVSGSDCFDRLERVAETTFKRVYFERSGAGEELIRLQPLNPAYSPRTFPREEIAGLYAAVYVVRRVAQDLPQ